MEIDEQSASKHGINYQDLNEQFGNVSVSDEEDQIENENKDKKSRKINVSERQIKNMFGQAKHELDFPNYFNSQRLRVKLTP